MVASETDRYPGHLARRRASRFCPGMMVTPPHPEEHREAMRLEGCSAATWFETRSFAALLTMRLTSQHPITLLHLLCIQVHVAPHLLELRAHLRHARLGEGFRLRRG